jgi:uncharacterized glyoxalase superfamily protein PhnB
MSDASAVHLWHSLSFRDADAMIRWLTAVGFTEHAVYRDEAHPTRVVHAEMLWPPGGGIMFGSHRTDNDLDKQPGSGAAYLVTDDPDGAYRAALAAGGTTVRAPADQDYGGRGASVADPEGNTWSFGDYQPT